MRSVRDFEAINENLRLALAAFAHVGPAGRTALKPGLSLTYSGTPFGLFNTALVTAPLPGECGHFKDLLESAEKWFQLLSAPWSVWFCEEFLTPEERRQAAIALATRGFRLGMETPGMLAEEITPPRRNLPCMGFARVGDAATRERFGSIMSAAFDVPEAMAQAIYGSRGLWSEGSFRGWIGYLEGEAVSTVATIAGAGSIGLYAVATLPDYQQRGCAERLVRHALEEVGAETGLKRSVLESSGAGYSLYLRLGYRNVARFLVYVKR